MRHREIRAHMRAVHLPRRKHSTRCIARARMAIDMNVYAWHYLVCVWYTSTCSYSQEGKEEKTTTATTNSVAITMCLYKAHALFTADDSKM